MKNKQGNCTDFHLNVQSALSKLGALNTQQTAHEDIRAVLVQCSGNEHCISSFLAALCNVNEQSLSSMQRKELIKLYGYMAEVLESGCIPFLPRLVSILQRKLKELNPHLHEAVAASFGSLIHNTMHTFPDIQSSCASLGAVLKVLFGNLNTGNKVLQNGSALCLTKVIQHSPLECLKHVLDRVASKILETLTGISFKAHATLLESLINLILSVECEFEPYGEGTMKVLFLCLSSDDFMTRKNSIDAFYTIGAVLPETARPFSSQIIPVIITCRADKAKLVRDAAIEALAVYKKIAPGEDALGPQATHARGTKPKSLFRGPVNRGFFRGTKNGPLVSAKESSGELPACPLKATSEFESTPTQRLEGRATALERQNEELARKLSEVTQDTCSELNCMNQRLAAVEGLISTTAQLFEAKFAQLFTTLKSRHNATL